MRIAVCEDDVYEMRMIRESLRETLGKMKLQAKTECFTEGKELLLRLSLGERFDLYLLDIILDGEETSGIEIAERVKEEDPEGKVIFLTSNKEYAVDAFAVGAIHYLVKPVTQELMSAALGRFKAFGGREEECLKLKEGKEIRKFPMDQVIYVRSRDRGIEFHMKLSKWDAWVNLAFHVVESKMNGVPRFVKISRGCIVNLDYVRCIVNGECVLANGEILQVSRREQNEVQNRYNDYLFLKMEEEGRIPSVGGGEMNGTDGNALAVYRSFITDCSGGIAHWKPV